VGVPSTRLRLRVVPGSARPGIVGRYGDAWKVRVAEAPERGRANDAVLELVAKSLSLPRRDVELVSGTGAPEKVVELRGITEDEAVRRLSGGPL
jgi:uncharacterized protein YggU (UPF0235/DUF167 family)